jgi:hypothetical protein
MRLDTFIVVRRGRLAYLCFRPARGTRCRTPARVAVPRCGSAAAGRRCRHGATETGAVERTPWDAPARESSMSSTRKATHPASSNARGGSGRQGPLRPPERGGRATPWGAQSVLVGDSGCRLVLGGLVSEARAYAIVRDRVRRETRLSVDDLRAKLDHVARDARSHRGGAARLSHLEPR